MGTPQITPEANPQALEHKHGPKALCEGEAPAISINASPLSYICSGGSWPQQHSEFVNNRKRLPGSFWKES